MKWLMVVAIAALIAGCGNGSGVSAPSRVLISGGWGVPGLASAEIYLSPQGGFLTTGAMKHARDSHTSTRLNNGRVLVAGGEVESANPDGSVNVTPLASAELCSNSTGGFTETGSLQTARFQHTATALATGEVLVAGGFDGNYNSFASTELYDPSIGTFTAAAPMSAARAYHTATPLNDGRVLLAGGVACTSNGMCPTLNTAEIYDPASGTFVPTGNMNEARSGHTATLLAGGGVLIAGGVGADGSVLAGAEVYHPTTGQFVETGAMTDSRVGHVAVALGNGAVLIAGGGDNAGSYLNTTEVYNPAGGSFTPSGAMSIDRTGPAAILLDSGAVLLAGGWKQCPSSPFAVCLAPNDTAELYDPGSGQFSPTANMHHKRAAQAASRL